MPFDLSALFLALFVLCFVVWVVIAFKSSRRDGDLASVHPYRRMMPVIMRSKNESVVYFERWVPTEAMRRFLEERGAALGCGATHLIVAAIARGFHAHPNMNRFIAGARLYQRRGVWLSFSVKRKKLDAKAKIAVVKLEIPAEETLSGLCERVNALIHKERKDEATYLDKELSLFLKLPVPVLKLAFGLLKWADDHNLVPHGFITGDTLFTSCVVANLGSLNMDAGYHHLYEWGNCPIFVMAGRRERRVMPQDAEQGDGVRFEEGMWLKFTFDERVEDGLSARRGLDAMCEGLEDPERVFGLSGELKLA